MKFLKIIILIITPSVFLPSCSNIFMKADAANTPTNCFNMLWKNVDEHYSFFKYKNVNWDSVRTQYAPKVSDKISQDSLYKVLASMLYELRDGHVNLSTSTDRSRNWSWKDDYPDNFNANFVHRNYFKKDFKLTGSLPNQVLDSVGYVRYSSFSSSITEGDLDFVMGRFKNLKGIIIDVRDNGGGSMANVFKIMNCFVETKTLVGYANVKKGRAHSDFETPTPLYATPSKRREPFTKPVAILINRGCFSATTHFAAFMSLLPNVTLVGDQTGGGGGIPISADLPNGWQYRFSATYQTLPDGTQIENGVPADVQISTGAKEELAGKDAIIEKAIEIINSKKTIKLKK